MTDDLRSVADRLYGAEPAAFVEERTRLARSAREAGDRDLAARIGALTKPSAAASMVNDLVRHATDDLQRLLELGADLRAAQDAADRAALQRLTAERRMLLPSIAGRAADRAARRPGAAVVEELQQTLQAALTSEAAADAVRSGRLLHGLSADGLEEVDLSRAVAVPGGLPPMLPRPVRPVERPPDDGADRRAEEARAARRRADELRRTAEQAADQAEAMAGAVDERAAAAADRRADLDEAQRRLEDAERALATARDAAEQAEETAATAKADAERAEAAAEEAEREAD